MKCKTNWNAIIQSNQLIFVPNDGFPSGGTSYLRDWAISTGSLAAWASRRRVRIVLFHPRDSTDSFGAILGFADVWLNHCNSGASGQPMRAPTGGSLSGTSWAMGHNGTIGWVLLSNKLPIWFVCVTRLHVGVDEVIRLCFWPFFWQCSLASHVSNSIVFFCGGGGSLAAVDFIWCLPVAAWCANVRANCSVWWTAALPDGCQIPSVGKCHLWYIYPLANVYVTMKNHNFIAGKIPLFLWPFSIAFCMFTRGYTLQHECLCHESCRNREPYGTRNRGSNQSSAGMNAVSIFCGMFPWWLVEIYAHI